ncbi:MAG: DUF1583 domain-containing protein, partial [Planctomycetaceae bacterium]|nr:DUF1583 domain-containing protein [Planctomycetaceae bacterium]
DRRAGNQASSLLLLMTQYQGQGNTALAQQIAFRILQRTQAVSQVQSRNPMQRGQTQDSQARDQALRVLAQTGALQPLIEQVEERVRQSPDSPRLYEQLIDYHTAIGNRDRVQELLEQAVAQRPNALVLEFRLAKYLQENGKYDDACTHYLKLIKARPEWFQNEFYEMHNVFQQAQREKELAALVSEMDLRPFGHPYYVMNIAENLIREETTRDIGLQLFERCFDQFPSYRSYVVSNLYDPEMWKNERVYKMGLRGLLPDESTAAGEPWYGVADLSSYDQDGRVNGMFHRLFGGVQGTPRELELRKALEERVAAVPAWHGGKALLALLDIRTGKKEAGIAALQTLLADEALLKGMTSNTCWMIGQELDQLEQTRDLAIRLFTTAVADRQNNNNQIQYTPVVRLVRLYGETGQKERARDLLLDAMKTRPNYNNPEYEAYRMAENGVFAAGELLKLEMPTDAIRIYRDLLMQRDVLQQAGSWYGNQRDHFIQTARQGLDRTLTTLKPENAEAAISELLSPPEKQTASGPILDLMLITPSVEALGQQTMQSPLLQLLDSVGGTPSVQTAIGGRLQQLAAEYPTDISVAVVQAAIQLKHGGDAGSGGVERLLQILQETPLEQVPEGRRPNSRLRGVAAERIPVWLIARQCLERPEFQETGALLADFAIAGAERQVEEAALASILFEWGTSAATRDNLPEAEQRWSQLLDFVTRRPQAKPKPEPAAEPMSLRSPGGRRLPLVELELSTDGLGGSAGASPSHFTSPTSTQFVALYDDAADAVADDAGATDGPEFIPPLTMPQFGVTMAIAREAAKRKLPALSLRAVREALLGGPPVPVNEGNASGGSGVTYVTSSGGGITMLQQGDNGEGADGAVSSSLQSVMSLWDPQVYPASDVYDVLAPLVFPPNRPGEILLYEDSSGVDDLRVSSLGATFLEWAQRADRLDEVRQSITERRDSGLAKLAALVLDARIALLTGDIAAAETALRELDSALAGNLTQEAVLIGAHAAIPALQHPELLNAAVPVLQRVVEQQIQAIAITFEREPSITRLARKINASLHARGDAEALKKFYEDYLRCTQAFYARYSGEYGLWMQMQIVAQLSADAARNIGPELALEYLGQAGDVTFQEQGPINTGNALTAIASRIRSRSAEDRYALWRDWTLPNDNRRTVRMLTDSSISVGLPPVFYPLREEADGADLEFLKQYDLLSNYTLLIDAAREANALADLKPRVQEAVDAKLPNADVLWALVLVELEDPAAIPAVQQFAATVYDRYKIPENGRYRQPNVWGDALICLAAVERPELYDAAQPLIDWLINAEGYVAAGPRSRLLQQVAEVQFQKAGLPPALPRFNHWTQFSPSVFTGGDPAWWTVNEGRVARLTGDYSDALFLKYPLTGAFEFEFERLSSGQNAVDVQFNGTSYTANSDYLSISSVSGHDQAYGQKIGLEQRAGGFERIRIVSDGAQVKYYVADHLLYEEAVNPTSPWLALYGRFGTAVMRNVALRGQPQVPTEVPLFAGDRMEGWNTSTFGESQKPFRELAQQLLVDEDQNQYQYQQQQQLQDAEYIWEVTDGELHGRRGEHVADFSAPLSPSAAGSGSFSLTGRQSWLYYARALAAGERIQYEFFYVPGDTEIHPTLGRLGFLLAPDGVHTHWINNDEDRDTYQLDDANSLFETDFQRSAGTVPLVANDWNKVVVRLTGSSIAIELNGTPVFERPVGPADDTRFGLFRDGNVETRLRAATLIGEWSGKLPAPGDYLLALNAALPPAQQRIESTLLAATVPGAMQDYARDILLLARQQPDEQAFETLRNWVLPNDSHSDVRLFSKQAPIAPLPPVDGSNVPTRDGELLLPAWELVQLAQRLDRLPELSATLDAFPAGRPQDPIVRSAFQVLLSAGDGDDAAARQQISALQEAYLALPNEQSGPRTDVAALAALWAAAERPELGDDVRAFLDAATKPPEKDLDSNEGMVAYGGRVIQRSGPDFRELNDSWTNIAAAHLADRQFADAADTLSLSQWTLVATDTAPSRGLGLRPTSFRRTASGWQHMPGQVHSQLLFQSPLTGKFDIVARGTFGPPAPLLVGYGMNAVATIGDPYETLTAQLMRKHEKSSGFPVTELPETSELRISVDGTQVKYAINGSLVREQLLTPQPDPWIAVQAFDPGRRGILQSLQIEGEPTIPTEIRLLETSQLAGFRTEYFDTVTLDATNEQSAWQYLGEELVGRGFYNIRTPTLQSVLTYQRPMLEDGEFEFETYYVPGEIEVHPCIGRATFMLRPDGPKLHWRTDAQFERSGLSSDNEAEIPGALPAPLKEKDWNQVRVTLAGDRATLFVNGTEVAQIDLREPRERRNFGLFRFANRQKCRVRNFVYRGNWPTTVPSVAEQELAEK